MSGCDEGPREGLFYDVRDSRSLVQVGEGGDREEDRQVRGSRRSGHSPSQASCFCHGLGGGEQVGPWSGAHWGEGWKAELTKETGRVGGPGGAGERDFTGHRPV